ncbi:MAG TPA: thiamine pyrophosphate-binding protein [Bryobacteraceae bacterium]|jgi:acetolactate synthase-1/2/3 large subunit|nr:thiamine pyrophosphate-binding protein [Bryobacteraceae bacterium]
MTNAGLIIRTLQSAGVQRLFGMPGGGSNADLIEAARLAGLPFTLAHTETAAAFMATAQAEITGRPGACLATLGPGAASLMNGVANAFLERAPLIVLTDCQPGRMQHQVLPQSEIFEPVVKWTGRPTADEAPQALACALEAAETFPPGPAHIDLSSDVTNAPAREHAPRSRSAHAMAPAAIPPIVAEARRPLFLVGLGGRMKNIAALCERFSIPALVTYKAKGVVPDRCPWFGGVFTNGTLEREIIERADLLIAVGLDPVELIPRPWNFRQPVVSLAAGPMRQSQIPLAAALTGDVSGLLASLPLGPSEWRREEVEDLAAKQRARMRPPGNGLVPHRVVDIAAEVYEGARITVDAGAHMFPVMALWPASQPNGVLISNGLSTMGFALPAAIGAALLDRAKPVIAFTGDGGLLICLAELRTAARENVPVRVIVFDDGDLTLIKVKQQQRGYAPDGVRIGEIDWQSVSSGLGVRAHCCTTEEELRGALRESAGHAGPVLIAARISTATYQATLQALRG